MPSSSKSTPKLPTVSVVVPRMVIPPNKVPPKGSNNSKEGNSGPNKQSKQQNMSNTVITVQSEPSNAKPSIVDSVVNVNEASSNEISESEMRLVSSLAKLQKLEAMVHQLRDLLPDRLLDPMLPIVNPNAVAGRQVPKSPQMLYEQLSKAARAGVAEVKEFQSMWRAPEMKTIWELVDVRIKENGGQLLQPSGVWESDYDTLLEELVKEREKKNEEQRKSEEELERSRVQSTEGGWRAIVESFAMRNVPGVRVIPSKNEASIIVTLAKAGMSFKVHTIGEPQANNAPDWQVVNKAALGQPRSELEKAITDCLNARPRQWDLVYLLDMISSYSSIKQTPCIKCSKVTDTAARLPTIRQHKSTPSFEGQPPFSTWEAYHTGCV